MGNYSYSNLKPKGLYGPAKTLQNIDKLILCR